MNLQLSPRFHIHMSFFLFRLNNCIRSFFIIFFPWFFCWFLFLSFFCRFLLWFIIFNFWCISCLFFPFRYRLKRFSLFLFLIHCFLVLYFLFFFIPLHKDIEYLSKRSERSPKMCYFDWSSSVLFKTVYRAVLTSGDICWSVLIICSRKAPYIIGLILFSVFTYRFWRKCLPFSTNDSISFHIFFHKELFSMHPLTNHSMASGTYEKL